MGFVVQCDNAGCREHQEPELDVKNSEDVNKWVALCSQCGNPINSVTYFAKVQMKHLGQLYRPKQKQQAFAVKCSSCNEEGKPTLGANNSLLCFNCNNEHTHLGAPFKQMILGILKSK